MNWFWLIWSFDACCALGALAFFGLGIRTASSLNDYLTSWLPLLCFMAVILTGSIWLKDAGHLLRAKLLLCTGALPWLLWGGLTLIMILGSKGKWN